mmetsp:Transcript_3113/g.4530  ORF Transcript_3113/g.4530 Transcript_3113/m.4530 type:complete len:713 (-) Transcript_3113:2635-4773(-)
MGQENEEQAELIATIQHDHIKMKQWYNTAPEAKTALHAKYGSSYPSFWRDVVPWDGWKESRKLFLKSMELKEKKDRERMNDGGSTSSGTASNNDSSTDASAAAAPRKRRSRWGNSSTTSNSNDSSGDKPRKRKSRWGASADRGRDETPKPLSTNSTSVLDILPGLPTNLNSEQNQKLKELQKLLREANQKLENLEVEAARVDALPNDHPDRSPSPPPVYGVDGKRKNTRAFRWKERYTAQRQDTLEQILSLTTSNASATSSIAPSLFKRKRTRKIHIPVEDHPTYNFIGLIIGPRGKTQKEMENKTGCKIAIRGKGSVKEGARGRRDGKMMEGDDEPLHVVITGDNQANVDAAADMINDMLVVIDDDKNVHKQQQLRELALLNGTLKDDEYCPICAEKGHRAFECPKRFSMSKNAISVRCAICGDTSHPTRDCRQKAANGESAADAVKAEKELDSDYLAFMNELDGKPAGSNDTPSDTNAAAAAADRKQLASLVTTIEKSVGGVVTVCTPVPTTAKKVEAVPAPASTTGNSLITTISSRIVKSAPEPTEALASTTLAGAPGISESQQPLITSLGSTTTASAVPLPGAVGGIPAVAGPVPGVTVPAPSAIAPPTSLPPPPSSLPPPPPSSNYYGQQQQQQPAGSYYPSQYQAQNQQYPNDYGHQNTAANQQNYYGQQNQQQGAVSGWDYRNYYGSGHTGGDADGAGGFNWWES